MENNNVDIIEVLKVVRAKQAEYSKELKALERSETILTKHKFEKLVIKAKLETLYEIEKEYMNWKLI